MQSYSTHPSSEKTRSSTGLETAKALFSLSKPNIVGLTLVAALTGIYVGNQGVMPDMMLLFWLVMTLAPATAGACMLNNVYDQDIDRLMGRTASRALVSGRVSSRLTLIIGILLATLPIGLMFFTVNAMAALFTALAVFGYSVVYTIWAKRTTPWANQLGGIAGALPPVIGYAAVTGQVDSWALVLFAIMAIWQQPHALSLALKYRNDYAKAKIPVIPVVHGVRATKLRIFFYTVALLPISILPTFLGMTGMFYLVVAGTVSTVFLVKAARFLRSPKDYDMGLFLFSLVHLVVVFGAIVLDMSQSFSIF